MFVEAPYNVQIITSKILILIFFSLCRVGWGTSKQNYFKIKTKLFFTLHLGRGGAVAEVGGDGAGLSGTGTMWPDKSRILLL